MKRFIILSAISAAAISLIVSCQKPGTDDSASEIKGILVLNNGNWGSNDASISVYNPDTKIVTAGVFASANGRNLGDLGQDIIRCEDELYIAVNGSKIIFVTDMELKIKATIEASDEGSKLQPHGLAYAGGKVYVTYYEGFLGEIDTQTYAVRTTPVGPNPEGVAYAAGKLYVANSGGLLYETGYNNTVSVVDAATFTEEKTITVNCNPQKVVANDEGTIVYVTSFGNYADLQPMLQAIETATGTVSDTGYTDVNGIALGKDDTLLVVTGGYDENWNIAGTIWKHNAATNSQEGKFTSEAISPFYSISADRTSGQVFVGTSDYTTNGDMYIFDAAGNRTAKFDVQGMNPIKVLALE